MSSRAGHVHPLEVVYIGGGGGGDWRSEYVIPV